MVWLYLTLFVLCKSQCVEQTNACPPVAFLDSADRQVDIGGGSGSFFCRLFFSSHSPYLIHSALMQQNISIMQQAYAAMQNASFVTHDSFAYQGALYMMRQAISGAWQNYLIAKQILTEQAVTSPDCAAAAGCVEYATSLLNILNERSSLVPIDTVVETPQGVFCITLYTLILIYALALLALQNQGALGWKRMTLLFNPGLKYYRWIWLGVISSAAFKLAWWCCLLIGMGVQTGISPTVGRILFRIGVVLQFFTVLLFLFLWIRAYFAMHFESHKLSMICYIVLSLVGLGGLVAVLCMAILAEQGGYDFSVPFLYTLEWVCIAACIALTALALHKIVNPEHKEKVRGLYIILLVESILLCAITLGLILSFYVLYRPPLYAGGGWVQFFAMVAVPDLIMFGAFLTLIGYNCLKIREHANKRATQVSSTKSTSVMGTYDGGEGEEEMQNVPEKYRV